MPLTRVKCLVSMTTPRDVRLHGASITPAFVEFDMNAEGFGCLYLPSIAPQGPPTPSVVGAGMIGGSEPAVVGGIGSGMCLHCFLGGLLSLFFLLFFSIEGNYFVINFVHSHGCSEFVVLGINCRQIFLKQCRRSRWLEVQNSHTRCQQQLR